MESGGYGVLVGLHGVVLGTPHAVTHVGIAVEVSARTSIIWVARHVDKISPSIAPTLCITEVHCVAEVFISQRCLPETISSKGINRSGTKVQPASSFQGEPIIKGLQERVKILDI